MRWKKMNPEKNWPVGRVAGIPPFGTKEAERLPTQGARRVLYGRCPDVSLGGTGGGEDLRI